MATFPSHNLISEGISKGTSKASWNKSNKSGGASFDDINNNESINICIIKSQFLA